MINIILKSGTYTETNLRRELSATIPDPEDITIFLESMQITKQITKQFNLYELPMKITALAEPVTLYWTTYRYGSNGRIGIRASADWVKQYNYPYEMYFIGAYVDGRYVPVDSFYFNKIWWNALTTPLKIVKPGTEAKSWRMQIPKKIISQGISYTLPVGTQIQVKLMSTTKQYLTTLRLWGYRYDETVTFEYRSRTTTDERLLELRGIKFVDEISTHISADIKNNRLKIQIIMDELLHSEDQEYYNTAYNFENIIGNELIPQIEYISLFPEVTFTDINNNRELLKWGTDYSFDKIPLFIDFHRIYSGIGARRVRGATWWKSQELTNKVGLDWDNITLQEAQRKRQTIEQIEGVATMLYATMHGYHCIIIYRPDKKISVAKNFQIRKRYWDDPERLRISKIRYEKTGRGYDILFTTKNERRRILLE